MTTSLLPPNATTPELALEAATTRIDAIKTDIRALWSPDDCPEELLPWLAWSLSLDSWSAGWSETVKRARVRAAIAIARRKGTAESVASVVESFGGAVTLREWWQDGGTGVPHTFDLVLTLASMNGRAATAAFVDAVIAEVERTKPVRSHFTFTQGIATGAGLELAAFARPVTYARLTVST